MHDLRAGTGTDCPESDVWYVSNIPGSLDHVLFTLAMGCCTAGTGQWSQSSVAQSILDKGAHSVIGFVDIINSACGWTFAYEFFDVLLNPLMTVEDAAYLGAAAA